MKLAISHTDEVYGSLAYDGLAYDGTLLLRVPVCVSMAFLVECANMHVCVRLQARHSGTIQCSASEYFSSTVSVELMFG